MTLHRNKLERLSHFSLVKKSILAYPVEHLTLLIFSGSLRTCKYEKSLEKTFL
jgi:hypothetical protein